MSTLIHSREQSTLGYSGSQELCLGQGTRAATILNFDNPGRTKPERPAGPIEPCEIIGNKFLLGAGTQPPYGKYCKAQPSFLPRPLSRGPERSQTLSAARGGVVGC